MNGQADQAQRGGDAVGGQLTTENRSVRKTFGILVSLATSSRFFLCSKQQAVHKTGIKQTCGTKDRKNK